MNAATAAAMGRAFVESQMDSECVIFTPGDQTTDPDTGEVAQAELDPAPTICKIRPAGTQAQGSGDAGGAEVIASGYVVSVPFSFTPVPVEKRRVRIISCPDPALIGSSLEIRQVAKGGTITARRLLCEEVT